MIRALAYAAMMAVPVLVAYPAFAQTTVPQANPSSPSPRPSEPPAPADLCSSGIGAIVTRPTQTTSVCVVKPNHVLVETGYQTETVKAPGPPYTFQSVPNAEIRVGTELRNVEIDVFPPNSLRSAGVTALADVAAGVKWQIASTPTFAYGVNVNGTAPTGSNPLTNPSGLGSANFGTATYNVNVQGVLGSVFGYGGTLSENDLVVPTGRRYSSFVPSLSLSMSLPQSTSLFAEVARFTNAGGPGTPTRTQYIVGVTRDVRARMQLDVETGFSPTAATGKYRYLAAGASYYF